MDQSRPDPQKTMTLRRVPLVCAALAMAAGVVAGRYAGMPLAFWSAIIVASLATAGATLLRRRWHGISAAAIVAAIFALGAAHTHLAYFAIPDDHVATYTGPSTILATLRGRVATAPIILTPEDDPTAGYQHGPKTVFLLEAASIRTSQGLRQVSGLVKVTVREPHPSLAVGQRVELVGTIGRYHGPSNPGEADRRVTARANGTLAWMTVPVADGAIVLEGQDAPWYRSMLWRLRAAARQHLTEQGDAPQGRLLTALVIGERHPALRNLSRAMIRAGTAHLLSISGLHLGIFLGFVFLLCRLCALSPRRSAAVVMAVLAAYVLLAEPRAPLLRSAVMAAALCASLMLGRRHMPLNALAGAAIVLLAVDPLQLFQAGFQLSFAIVGGLILFAVPVRRLIFGRWLRRRGLMVFRHEDRIRRWVYFTLVDWLTLAVSASLLAWISAAPLIAYHFGLFNPYAPLLSLLMFPLVVAVLLPGYISLALAWPMPNLSYQLGRAATAAADLLHWAAGAADDLPALSLSLRPVPWHWVLLCYAALVAVAYCRRVPLRRAAAAFIVAALVAATAYTQREAPHSAAAELHLLSVGAGQCVVLRTPEGQTFLIDAGSQGDTDLYYRKLQPFLRQMRFQSPHAAFLSHANTDHYNAMPAVLQSRNLRRVYLNDYFGMVWDDGPGVYAMMDLFARHRVKAVRLRAGQTIRLGDRTIVEVLWPPAERRDDLSTNDTSLVLRIVCDGRRVLVTGDLDSIGQAELAAQPERIASDVLVIPHHGGWEKTLPEFVQAVGAQTVLVSAAREPRAPAGSPAAARFYNQLKRAPSYYSTCRNGWVRVRFGAGKVHVQTMR